MESFVVASHLWGFGQALLQNAARAGETGEPRMPYYLARNEQGMVHAAAGFAKTRDRLQTLACTASIGPGSANMLTVLDLQTKVTELLDYRGPTTLGGVRFAQIWCAVSTPPNSVGTDDLPELADTYYLRTDR